MFTDSFKDKIYSPWVITAFSTLVSLGLFLVIAAAVGKVDFTFGLTMSTVVPVVVTWPVSYWIIFYYKKVKRQNHEIEEKNGKLLKFNEEIAAQRDLLEAKNIKIECINNDLTESIAYAQHIQQAMLPPLPRIRAHLPQSFVFLKPRNVVSGDFYWFKTVQNKVFIAAIDCTGHGVPGALMSMTGNNLLNDIVETQGTTQPQEILNQLHLGVKKALQQDETNNRDGMDAALCAINLSTNVVEFTGAKRPLVYIQNHTLHEIKGDIMPIGGEWNKNERKFTHHTIVLSNEPTTFYMFSDGYQDQFGGSRGKKFMKKRLKRLLLDIHLKPMDEQKQILDNTILQWMKQENLHPQIEQQIDDILLIGFRLVAK
ncbi:SpoIIE family protein phosphatase [uncultured Microscilla sp.]|uniref:PP2C family protein-serine/threonine phosphatase n=1 Tax=uncultured Microscilla sp. TaxID=432653 RepID=UPI002614C96B|nr:SpoIIE family protein phosphatase [uncultured Microscilla sp.]